MKLFKNALFLLILVLFARTHLIAMTINGLQADLDDQLVYAAQYGNTKTVTALIAAGANINATYRSENALYASPHEWAGNKKGDTALMLAAKFGRTDIVKILIAAGANVNAVNGQGETALMKTVEFLKRPEQFSNTLTVKILLEAGANISATNEYGQTALELATEKGRDSIVDAINEHLKT